ncbi:SDR family oxidoreductase [Bacillus sp. FJAT-49825]|uniref:SDR family oxidoreductase n=1 Tax=Neobacillus rhizophilus TaxID=2833579 RepID=A0A942YYH0_9BACI|nr:SDR family oxidoreductase [Neobacillus rhizophilus]
MCECHRSWHLQNENDRENVRESNKHYRGFHPRKKDREAKDLEGVIIFLASAAANYVTGQVIAVDGGQSSW